MQCPRCHNEIDENVNFCTHCGVKISKCPACGKPNVADAKFCQHCGTALKTISPTASQTGYYNPTAAMPSSHSEYKNPYPHMQSEYHYHQQHQDTYYSNEVPHDKNVEKKVNWKKVIIGFLVICLLYMGADFFIANTRKISIQSRAATTASATFKASKNSQAVKNSNLANDGAIDSDGKNIYMSDDDGYLVKLDSSFKKLTDITTEKVSYINAVGDYVYYTNASHQIVCYDVNKKTNDVIVTQNSYYVTYYKNKLYYQNDSDEESLYVYDLETKKNERLVKDHVYSINVSDKGLYYKTKTGIGFYDFETKKSEEVLKGEVNTVIYNNGTLYYADASTGAINSYTLATKKSDTVAAKCIGSFLVSDKYLYYYTSEGKIDRIDLKTKEVKTVFKGIIIGIRDYQLAGEHLIVKENGKWNSVNTENKNKAQIFK